MTKKIRKPFVFGTRISKSITNFENLNVEPTDMTQKFNKAVCDCDQIMPWNQGMCRLQYGQICIQNREIAHLEKTYVIRVWLRYLV